MLGVSAADVSSQRVKQTQVSVAIARGIFPRLPSFSYRKNAASRGRTIPHSPFRTPCLTRVHGTLTVSPRPYRRITSPRWVAQSAPLSSWICRSSITAQTDPIPAATTVARARCSAPPARTAATRHASRSARRAASPSTAPTASARCGARRDPRNSQALLSARGPHEGPRNQSQYQKTRGVSRLGSFDSCSSGPSRRCPMPAVAQGRTIVGTGWPSVTRSTARSPSGSASVAVAVRRAPTAVHACPRLTCGCRVTRTTIARSDSTASAV